MNITISILLMPFHRPKKAICVYDYIYWNSEINKLSAEKYDKIFTDNINKSDFVLYACPAIKDLVVKKFGNKIVRKMYPIIDGYDPNKFYIKDYNKNNNQNNKLVVGWVGNSLNTYKNLDTLKNLVKDKNWIELKIQDKSTPIPHDEMVNFYHSVDVLVCVSSAEGTPNPILEAAACGKPWISTNVGIVNILNNITATTIKPGFIINDPSELLEKLEILHKNRAILREMGMIGSMCVKRGFTWDNQVKQFETVFNLV